MSITSFRCPVLGGAAVACLSDLEGHVTQVICGEYDEGLCRLKKQAQQGGALSQFLERVAEGSMETRSAVCAAVFARSAV